MPGQDPQEQYPVGLDFHHLGDGRVGVLVAHDHVPAGLDDGSCGGIFDARMGQTIGVDAVESTQRSR